LCLLLLLLLLCYFVVDFISFFSFILSTPGPTEKLDEKIINEMVFERE
jgi:hypothetical protein